MRRASPIEPVASCPTPTQGAQDPAPPPRPHDDSEMQRFLDTYSHVAKATRQEAASRLDILGNRKKKAPFRYRR